MKVRPPSHSLFLLVVILLASACDNPTQTLRLAVGNPAASGKEWITEQDMQGRLVFINYWAEWCKPCLKEIPDLNEFHATHSEKVLVLGVNADNLQGEALLKAVNGFSIQFPVLEIDPAKTFQLPVVDVLPVTFILDENGILLQTLKGPQTTEDLLKLVEKHGK